MFFSLSPTSPPWLQKTSLSPTSPPSTLERDNTSLAGEENISSCFFLFRKRQQHTAAGSSPDRSPRIVRRPAPHAPVTINSGALLPVPSTSVLVLHPLPKIPSPPPLAAGAVASSAASHGRRGSRALHRDREEGQRFERLLLPCEIRGLAFAGVVPCPWCLFEFVGC